MVHLTFNIGIGQRWVWEELSTFRHLTFDFQDLGVERRNWNSWEKTESHSQSHSESYYLTRSKCHLEIHLESNLESY